MDLPLARMGAAPVDLVRRPPPNEDTVNPDVFQQRYFAMASLRILLSDTAADLTSLPTATLAAPDLSSGWRRIAGPSPSLRAMRCRVIGARSTLP